MTIPPALRARVRCFGSSAPRREGLIGPKMKIVYIGEEQKVENITFSLAIDLKNYTVKKVTIHRVDKNLVIRATRKLWGLFEVSTEIQVYFPQYARIFMSSRYPNVLLFKHVTEK